MSRAPGRRIVPGPRSPIGNGTRSGCRCGCAIGAVGLLVLLVVLAVVAVVAVGISAARAASPQPTVSTSTRSTP